ncbi:MAG: GerMN domain-containing protein [Candidatus Magnetoovum sp. WYHC-5]|nr:GerMN domain-containing protein [Candidatus Magnetoovum sp. WYHC-5]
MQQSKAPFIIIFFLLIIIIGGIAFFIHSSFFKDEIDKTAKEEALKRANNTDAPKDVTSVKVYNVKGRRLVEQEVKINQTSDSMALVEEAIKGFLSPQEEELKLYIPHNTTLMDVYYGIDNVLYINLSSEFTKNFQGDTPAEFLILKGLYKTVIANASVADVKLIVNDLEVETLGGHFLIKYPIKRLVSQEVKFEQTER